MIAQDIIAKIRLKTQDNGITQLWSDEEIINNINEALKEACLRKNILYKKLSLLSVNGTASYSIGTIFRVMKVRYDNALLKETTVDDVDESGSYGKSGTVRNWYIDEDDLLYLSLVPLEDDKSILVEGYAVPDKIVALEDVIVFPDNYLEPALNWAYKLCYEKLDAEVSRPDLSSFFENEFVKVFDTHKTASQWKQHKRSFKEQIKTNYF